MFKSDKKRVTILLGANGRKVIDLEGTSVKEMKALKSEEQKKAVDEILGATKGKAASKEKPLSVKVKKKVS